MPPEDELSLIAPNLMVKPEAPMGPPAAPVAPVPILGSNDLPLDLQPPPEAAAFVESAQTLGVPPALAKTPPPVPILGSNEAPLAREPQMIPGTPGSVEVAGTLEQGLSPEDAAARRGERSELEEMDRNAALDSAIAAHRDLQAREQHNREATDRIRNDQMNQAAEERVNQQRRKELEGRIEKALAQQPDRGRMFPTGAGLVATLIGTLAGGLLRGTAGGPNTTLDALDHVLDDDIKMQREDRNSLLHDLGRQLGDLDAAENILRGKQRESVAEQLQARLAGTGLKSDAAKISAVLTGQFAEARRRYLEGTKDLDRQLKIEYKNNPGTPDQPFNVETYQASEFAKLAASRGLKPYELQKQWRPFWEEKRKHAEAKKRLGLALDAVQKFEKDNDVSGFGIFAKHIPTGIAADDAKAMRQQMGFIISSYLKEISGAAVTEPEFARVLKNIEGAGTATDVMRGLGLVKLSFDAQDEALSAGEPAFDRIYRTSLDMQRQELASNDQYKREQDELESNATRPIIDIPKGAGPRGTIAFRHNNPGNLTYTSEIKGAQRGEPKKGGGYWRKFSTPNEGFVAMVDQLRVDSERGLNLRQLIDKYAPAKDDNDVDSYVARLKARFKGQVDDATPLTDIPLNQLAYFMANIESGSAPPGGF